MFFYEKLYKLRKKAGLTQAELAEKLNVSRQAVSKWETGSVLPETKKMNAIAVFFGVTIDYLLDKNKDQENNEIPAQASSVSKNKSRKHIIFMAVLIGLAFVLALGIVRHSLVSVLTILLLIMVVFSIILLAKKLVGKKNES